jgi:hypothetical protein
MKRALKVMELASLKADIDKGLTDLAEGRVKDFYANRIVERGKKLLTAPLPMNRITACMKARDDLHKIRQHPEK